jgi:nicotinamide mononucleotide (NMN) deamidase PncC
MNSKPFPRQMWNGIREQISPSILAVATILVIVSVALLDDGGTAAPAVGTVCAAFHPRDASRKFFSEEFSATAEPEFFEEEFWLARPRNPSEKDFWVLTAGEPARTRR